MTGLRVVAALGGLAGFAGVGLSALAAHVTGPGSLATAASFLLAHAPVLLAVAALVEARILGRRRGLAAAGALAAGLVLFCGDLSLRALAGWAPVPMAAPIGGGVLMAGWLLLVAAAVRGRPGDRRAG